jgi:hypothetical protein
MKVKTLVFEDSESLVKFIKQSGHNILSVRAVGEDIEVVAEFYGDIPINPLISVFGSNQFRLRDGK